MSRQALYSSMQYPFTVHLKLIICIVHPVTEFRSGQLHITMRSSARYLHCNTDMILLPLTDSLLQGPDVAIPNPLICALVLLERLVPKVLLLLGVK